jgi:hypothetical protein
MAVEPVTWHADPAVAERAVFGRFMAELWFTCEEDDWGWAVFSLDDPPDAVSYPVEQDRTAGYEAAKARAEATLRRLSAASRSDRSEQEGS